MNKLIVGNAYQVVPEKVEFNIDNQEIISRVIEQLVLVCEQRKAVSLSAPQLGHNLQVFVLKDYDGYRSFVNPKIVHEFEELAQATEISLSYPGLAVKVNRPYSVRVRYQTSKGETKTETLEGGLARLFQHEMSHMRGKPYWEDANFINRNKAIKDWKSIKRKLSKVSGALPPV